MRVAIILCIAIPLLGGCDTLKDFAEWLTAPEITNPNGGTPK